MLSAPLRLTAMTLRCLGPYLHGERLEIRPLTILCGENGSGKSTWIEMLSKFKTTAADERFPFVGLLDPDRTDSTLHSRNLNGVFRAPLSVEYAWLAESESDIAQVITARESLVRKQDDATFGPPCTIGLELQVAETADDWSIYADHVNLIPDSFQGDTSSNAARLLWYGKPSPGTKINLRWAYPDTTFDGESSFLDGLMDLMELTIDDVYCIRLFKNLKGYDRDPVYKLEASALFISGSADRADQIQSLGKFNRRSEACDSIAEALGISFIHLFRALTRQALDGFFHIGAIRPLQKGERSGDLDEKNSRYVGVEGEHAQTLLAHWKNNLMRQPSEPFTGEIDNRFTTDDFPNPRLSVAILHETPFYTQFQAAIDPQIFSQLSDDEDDTALELLNRVLSLRDLFHPKFLPEPPGLPENAELEKLVGKNGEKFSHLTDDEITRVNRLLVEYWLGYGLCRHCNGYFVETFIDYWLHRLTGANVGHGMYRMDRDLNLGKDWRDDSRLPNGGPIDNIPNPYRRVDWNGKLTGSYQDDKLDEGDWNFPDQANVVTSPTIGMEGGWHLMSCGFHQLAPIIVQAALMRRHEIMAVENPEAHLHPSLQVQVAEFLLHQANAGKVILVETHSDLLVRRILRALREEDIQQEAVRIYFTHLKDGPREENYKYAAMECLQINEKRQITNWPSGFMDDDLKEANKWLMTMESLRFIDDDS